MESVKEILREIKHYNADLSLEDGKLRIKTQLPLPDPLIKKIKRHKETLKSMVAIEKLYHRIAKTLEDFLEAQGGYVLVKSSNLKEVVAFCLPQYVYELTKKGFICYLPDELAELLIKRPEPHELRSLHEIKKIFEGKILH